MTHWDLSPHLSSRLSSETSRSSHTPSDNCTDTDTNPNLYQHYAEFENSSVSATTTSYLEDEQPDGHDDNDIAICGFSIKFSQDAITPQAFWNMISEKRCAMTDFPPDRMNLGGFYKAKNKLNTLPLKGGHFIKDDLAVFDADFFIISPTEAAAMDPMQRWLLEAAYRALENAGISMETVSGSSTAVYTGSFGLDYMVQLTRDPEAPPTYAAVGFGLSMLANRLSWFFNLSGPSIGLDSACSSTAMAIDIACQGLRNGSSTMAMVAGSNLTSAPESYTWMSNLGFLSPESRCHSFDHRANGYARGEGIGVLILKKVRDAIRDGNTIRAVIRATGSNEDGRTPGITQPSREAQERLIRSSYSNARLSMAHTRLFEAHGTGTPIGDPREAQAIGAAFRKFRSVHDPLFVGAVKSNIGHLEGASGLAGVIKTVLALEKAIIPPNTNFEKLNPKIDAEFLKLKFPQESQPWPSQGLRRASVNSFGYGGSNSHIVLDDAYNYLRLRLLQGNHCTVSSPPSISSLRSQSKLGLPPRPIADPLHVNADDTPGQQPKLCVWSAADRAGMTRIADSYRDWQDVAAQDPCFLDNLAFTLDSHRTHLPWRSFALLESPNDLSNLKDHLSTSSRAVLPEPPRLGFVFSGQGAQWFAMGRELLCYSSYKAELQAADRYLTSLGCQWSLMDELMKTKESSNVDKPAFSQPLCTALQIALVNLLATFGVTPSAVVGHSSGENAAAYAGGYLSRESAWKLAYFRGLCSEQLAYGVEEGASERGAMMSVGLSEAAAESFVATVNQEAHGFGVAIACVNSPTNVTLSGEEKLIDILRVQLDEQGVFARKLRVPLAYHSGQMSAATARFVDLVGSLSGPTVNNKILPSTSFIPMISSVTTERVGHEHVLDPAYWALNMVSPVQFSSAVLTMCSNSHAALVKKLDKSDTFASVVDHLVEIGPHAALQGPIRDILVKSPRGKSISYTSLLRRGHSALETTLRAMGELHNLGCVLSLRVINEPSSGEHTPTRSLLVNLPEYPFDHSQRYWHESRLSQRYRLRPHAPSELLGVQTSDWDPADARWRHLIRPTEMPWVTEHVVNGVTLYPGTGMLVMAIEAAKQLAMDETKAVVLDGYTLRSVDIVSPIDITAPSTIGLEVQTSLREVATAQPRERAFAFTIKTYNSTNSWQVNCRGFIAVHYGDSDTHGDSWEKNKTLQQRRNAATMFSNLSSSCTKSVDSTRMYRFLRDHGYEYGPNFQSRNQRCDPSTKRATAEVILFEQLDESHVVHPSSLDTILHLAFTALTAGGSIPMATSVPSHIKTMWISDTGLNWPDQASVTAYSSIDSVAKTNFVCSSAAMDSSSGELRFWAEGLQLTNITSAPASLTLPNPKQFCMHVDLKPAISKLSAPQLMSLLDEMHPTTEDKTVSDFFQDLDFLVMEAISALTESIDPKSLENSEPWKQRYWSWAKHHLSRRLPNTSSYPQPLQKFDSDRLKQSNPVGNLYTTLATNLANIFTGHTNPLELLMQTGLLKSYYEDLSTYRCSKQIASYISLLAHDKPGLSILEVGGGTASATRNLTTALTSHSESTTLRCSHYTFTDVSAAFLDHAREEFSRYDDQMSFGVLDIEKDIAEQGVEPASYDVIVADNVLHVTADLGETLRNMRKALKTGGKLVMHELLKAEGWTAGFVFGVFPGWWLGGEHDGRELSPNMDARAWDVLLRECGFSGTELVFKDFEDELAHHLGWVIATAVEEEVEVISGLGLGDRDWQGLVVVDKSSEIQQLLARELVRSLRELLQVEVVSIVDMGEVGAHVSMSTSQHGSKDDDKIVIFLADFVSPKSPALLASLDSTKWMELQALLQASHHILWVSSGGGKDANPDNGMIDGLARTLRSEYYELHLVTLALSSSGSEENMDPSWSSTIVNITREMLSRAPHQPYEQEYVEIDGRIHTRRLVEAQYLKEKMDAKLVPYQVISTHLDGMTQFKASISPSLLAGKQTSSPQFVEYVPAEDLPPEQVEIMVKAVLLGSTDESILQEQSGDQEEGFGRFCAGLVTRCGKRAKLMFRPGDHVVVACASSLRSHVRAPLDNVARIPSHLNFARACHDVSCMVTAYHALVETSRPAMQNEAVLVLGGAGSIGQAAIRLLVDRGLTDIWTTAEGQEDAEWITQALGIPEDRVLPHSWFSGGELPAMERRYFDLVFSANRTPPLLLSHVLRNNGRYVMFKTTSTSTHSSNPAVQLLNTAPSKGSVTAFSRDFAASSESLRSAANMLHYLTDSDNQVMSVFPAPNLEDAFNRLRVTDKDETVVVTLDVADIVKVNTPTRPTYMLDPNSTYLVSGGLGGLGRAMVRWLAIRGARYLILLSRSGPQTPQAQQLLSKLGTKGIHIETPICDITDAKALQSTLVEYSTRGMPPIKGCIQASMVMTELVFSKMDFPSWNSSVSPKVTGSWNLHTLLPPDLDFFVLITSMMGILGGGSLAAYNAGNTYQDALARYRVSRGQTAFAIDLGAVPDGGYLAEHESHQHHVPGMARIEKYALTFTKELCALLDVYCDPDTRLSMDVRTCQAVVGVRPVSHWQHLEEVPATMAQPFWGHMHHVPLLKGTGDEVEDETHARKGAVVADTIRRVKGAETLTEAAEIASDALARRVSALLGTAEDRLDVDKPMYSYGIDSLSAIEVRNWVAKVFDVDLPVFEILGGATLASAGMAIVRKVNTCVRRAGVEEV